MKLFIMIDMEGITGVVSFKHQAIPGGPLYPEARSLLMRDLNAAIEGAVAEGVDEVLVYDTHYYGLNVILEELHSSAKVILGQPLCKGLDNTFDCAMLIGYHSMAGTPDGLLAHTYAHDVRSILLNGMPVGEIGMEMALAGQLGVPVIMVSGDSAGLAEARDIQPDVTLATVKWSLAAEGAVCLPVTESEIFIRSKAREAVKRASAIRPFSLQPPFEIKMQFSNPDKVRRLSQEQCVTVHDDLTITIKDKNLDAAWLKYRKVENECREDQKPDAAAL